MNEKELMSMMEKDANINDDDLFNESLRTQKLYSKYQKLFYEVTLMLHNKRQYLNKRKCDLFEYWLGKADDEVYINKPKPKRIVKSDVEIYIKADEEYCNAESEVVKLELISNMLDNYLKQIANRNFAIKNAIELLKFKNGGY